MSDTGHKLELRDATDHMIAAFAPADADAARQAIADHATALNSQATAMAASIAAPVYTQLAEIKTMLTAQAAQLSASVTVQDQRFTYVLNQLAAHLEKEDARHGVYDQSEATTLAALTSVAKRLDEITSYVQQSVTIAREALTVSKENGRGLGKLQDRVSDLDQQHGARIDAVIVRLDHKREVLRGHADRIQALEDNNARLDALEATVRRLAAERGEV